MIVRLPKDITTRNGFACCAATPEVCLASLHNTHPIREAGPACRFSFSCPKEVKYQATALLLARKTSWLHSNARLCIQLSASFDRRATQRIAMEQGGLLSRCIPRATPFLSKAVPRGAQSFRPAAEVRRNSPVFPATPVTVFEDPNS